MKTPIDTTATELAKADALPPIVIPPPVRYFVARARQGASLTVLRDSNCIATIEVEGPHALANVIRIVRTSVAKDGDARFSVLIDGQEVDWQTNSFETPVPQSAGEAQAFAWARSMEGFAMRMMDKAMSALDQTHKHAQEREKSLAKLVQQQAKALKVLGRAIRKNSDGGASEVELARIGAESEERGEGVALVREFLPVLTGGALGGGSGDSGLAKKILALLNENELAAIVATEEGRCLQSAGNDTMARVALRALFDMVRSKQIELRAEVIQQAMALYNGGAS